LGKEPGEYTDASENVGGEGKVGGEAGSEPYRDVAEKLACWFAVRREGFGKVGG